MVVPEYIDLRPYFNDNDAQYKNQESNKMFRCVGVVAHRGPSGDSGHYVAYCRGKDNNNNNNWYLFNDKEVTKCEFVDCMNREDEQIVYMAFYEKCDNIPYGQEYSSKINNNMNNMNNNNNVMANMFYNPFAMNMMMFYNNNMNNFNNLNNFNNNINNMNNMNNNMGNNFNNNY